MNHTIEIGEEERQATLMALAHLAVERPGWDDMLRRIAAKMDNAGEPMFSEFKATHAEANRPVFVVRCEATQDLAEITADTPAKALDEYLAGYRTSGPDGEPIGEGVKYSTLTVWLPERECRLSCEIFADGHGGWVQGVRR